MSPMIGARLLHHVDIYFASREEIFYVRYMDDAATLFYSSCPMAITADG
ncbi:hypothetical protein [Yersinia enterocolitica]|nr:hypothetical protein [Yersinia enterocolitica]MCY1688738.1 hypothetical protein [Yersinia enterocolitica]